MVAEGVETQEQLEHLRAAGCDEVQGYFIARPLSAEDCEAFLRNAAEQEGAEAVGGADRPPGSRVGGRRSEVMS